MICALISFLEKPTELLEYSKLTIPILLSTSAIVFTFTLGIFTVTTRYVSGIAYRIKNYAVAAYIFAWFAFLTVCGFIILQLLCYKNWICQTTIFFIVITLTIVSAILYYGVKLHWEYLIFKTTEPDIFDK
jgi:hypothetical protein